MRIWIEFIRVLIKFRTERERRWKNHGHELWWLSIINANHFPCSNQSFKILRVLHKWCQKSIIIIVSNKTTESNAMLSFPSTCTRIQSQLIIIIKENWLVRYKAITRHTRCAYKWKFHLNKKCGQSETINNNNDDEYYNKNRRASNAHSAALPISNVFGFESCFLSVQSR